MFQRFFCNNIIFLNEEKVFTMRENIADEAERKFNLVFHCEQFDVIVKIAEELIDDVIAFVLYVD